ncbi:MAG: dITP/XTP pyrophosphatase [Chlamydiales bacterium]|nr:dITP/XTP pyrophosphatase [Chlamydiales bacterium]MCH9619570.1 dITP/XTP pyrophosphatase [Chlamydiales bacterium]MCH9623176.1 dITP/XTP pyrophosphatase [Chlamydiales bacterium]
MQLLIASKNGHKIREIKSYLSKLKKLDIYSLLEFPNYIPPEETEETFEGNAKLKAKHAARELQMWTVADDSGLVVPALKGAPGVRSARFAGPKATDKDNRQKLLKEMEHLQDGQRAATFECSLAIAMPDATIKKCLSGSCEGVIISKERGGLGFGYDPLFMKHDYNKTFAELGESIKNKVSHRAKALSKLVLYLESSL